MEREVVTIISWCKIKKIIGKIKKSYENTANDGIKILTSSIYKVI